MPVMYPNRGTDKHQKQLSSSVTIG